MQKISWICDKCGAEINDRERFLVTTGQVGDQANAESVDLCGMCYIGALKVLKIYLTGAKTVPTTEKPAEPKKPKAKPGGYMKKKKLDLGKIAALRNAGWSLEKIADELGCCTQTVANHMKEARDFLKEHQNDYYKQEEHQDE